MAIRHVSRAKVVRVKNTGIIGVEKLYTQAKRNRSIVQRSITAFDRKYGPDLTDTIRLHYGNLSDELSAALFSGIGGGPGTAQVSVPYKAPGRKPHRHLTTFQGLSRQYLDYEKRPPESLFWINKGDLWDHFEGKNYLFSNVKFTGFAHIGSDNPTGPMKFTATFKLGKLTEPLDSLLRLPFISAARVRPGAQYSVTQLRSLPNFSNAQIQVDHTRKLGYVEGRRPFVARLAGTLGSALSADLRKGLPTKKGKKS